MNDIIHNDIRRSEIIHWVGNISYANKIGLTINQPYIDRNEYSNEIIKLHDDSQER